MLFKINYFYIIKTSEYPEVEASQIQSWWSVSSQVLGVQEVIVPEILHLERLRQSLLPFQKTV